MPEFELSLISNDGNSRGEEDVVLKVANYGFHDCADQPIVSVNGERVDVERLRKFCTRVLELTSDRTHNERF